jgi:heme A synthase
MRSRALALGGLLTVLVLSGVFFPIFAMRIIDGYLFSAIFLVLVLWVVWYFTWTLPRRRQPVVEVAEDKGEQADA